MDGKTGMGVVLVLTGIFVAFLAVTGKANAIIQAITGQSVDTSAPKTGGWTSDPGQAGTSAGAGGSYGAPNTPTPTTPTTSTNVGFNVAIPNDILQAIEYNSLVGTDGVKAVPYGAQA